DYAAVVPTTDPTRATLVLSSCHPIRSASHRIIIRADLDTTRSSPLFSATTHGTADAGATIPGDDTGSAPATSVATPSATDASSSTAATAQDTAPATTIGAVAQVPATTAPPLASTTTAPTADAAPSASRDAFSAGWFDDPAAWPQIIVWGLALAAITCAGYLVARRTRRIWFGTLVAFAPFVFVLYFWFENINRLLPPGL
ncbi:MAG: peptidase family protein, partial [Ilumatobacteraceae bacterium]|nr:peptidase family protein [Ilumatobacteraceae bacterium]